MASGNNSKGPWWRHCRKQIQGWKSKFIGTSSSASTSRKTKKQRTSLPSYNPSQLRGADAYFHQLLLSHLREPQPQETRHCLKRKTSLESTSTSCTSRSSQERTPCHDDHLHVRLHPYKCITASRLLDDIAEACRHNTHIRNVTLHVGTTELESLQLSFLEQLPRVAWNRDQLAQLSQALFSLPCLEYFVIHYDVASNNNDDTTVLLELLRGVSITSSTTNLVGLHIKGWMFSLPITEEGHDDEWEALNNASRTNAPNERIQWLANLLSNHPTLCMFRLHGSSTAGSLAVSIDPLLQALTTLPKLEHVLIADHVCHLSSWQVPVYATTPMGSAKCSGAALRDVLTRRSSSPLKSLHLLLEERRWENTWKAHDVLQVAQGLQHNCHLLSLVLGNRTNTNAKKSDNRRQDNELTNDYARTDLHQFHLAAEALVRAIQQHNFVLQELILLDFMLLGKHNSMRNMTQQQSIHRQRLDLFLKLNQAGRQHLLGGNASHERWIQSILAHRQDLDVSFELLSMNPPVLYS